MLLDAIRIGEGAAGRNSGFMIDLPHDISTESYTNELVRDKQETAMNRTAIAFSASVADEFGFTKEMFDPRGKINVAATEKGYHHNQAYVTYLETMGEAYTVLDGADIRKIAGTPYYISGLHTPGAVMIQPAAFVRGWAEGMSHTVDIYENSPVIALEKEGHGW